MFRNNKPSDSNPTESFEGLEWSRSKNTGSSKGVNNVTTFKELIQGRRAESCRPMKFIKFTTVGVEYEELRRNGNLFSKNY